MRMMTGTEIAGLKWLADLMKTLTGAVLSDRFKRKTSEQRAWTRGKALWSDLGNLNRTSQDFVSALKRIAEDEERYRTDLEEFSKAFFSDPNILAIASPRFDLIDPDRQMDMLLHALHEVQAALSALSRSLEAIDPQLQIHVPSVERRIVESSDRRAEVVIETWDLMIRKSLHSRGLNQIIHQAHMAQSDISQATESMREFLASQFSFKDSF